MMAYGESHRYYHDVTHLNECLVRWDQVRSHATDPAMLEFAIWFHDGSYDPRRTDNEARSARWLAQVAIAAGLGGDRIAWAVGAIIATQHQKMAHTGSAQDPDTQLLLDIDLGILAADRDRFELYCHQIRQEYAWVAESEYRHQRQQIFQLFLDRTVIFGTPILRDHDEEKARQNLQRAIAEPLMGWD
jgi:predicted metal-dependent HD superfamily phosphohydrolase